MSDNTMRLVKRGANYSIVLNLQEPGVGYKGTGFKVLRMSDPITAQEVLESCNNGGSKGYSWSWADFQLQKYAVVNNSILPYLQTHFLKPDVNEFGPVSP